MAKFELPEVQRFILSLTPEMPIGGIITIKRTQAWVLHIDETVQLFKEDTRIFSLYSMSDKSELSIQKKHDNLYELIEDVDVMSMCFQV